MLKINNDTALSDTAPVIPTDLINLTRLLKAQAQSVATTFRQC